MGARDAAFLARVAALADRESATSGDFRRDLFEAAARRAWRVLVRRPAVLTECRLLNLLEPFAAHFRTGDDALLLFVMDGAVGACSRDERLICLDSGREVRALERPAVVTLTFNVAEACSRPD